MLASPRVVRSAGALSGSLDRSRGLFGGDDEPKSRRERAFAVIEGRPLGFIEVNPWRPSLEIDPSIVRRIGIEGAAMLVELSDPFDALDSERLALLWDDQIMALGPIAVREGDRVLLVVDKVRGERLTLWTTDAGMVPRIVSVNAASSAGDVRRAEEKRASEEKGPGDAARGFFDKFMDTLGGIQKTIGVAGVVVAGVVGYLYLKGRP